MRPNNRSRRGAQLEQAETLGIDLQEQISLNDKETVNLEGAAAMRKQALDALVDQLETPSEGDHWRPGCRRWRWSTQISRHSV